MALKNMGNSHGSDIFYHPSTNRADILNNALKVQSVVIRKNTPRISTPTPTVNIPNPNFNY